MNLKDRRGYMLVEIILASAIAFGIAYFILDLTIKLKNKNDDLLVETQVATDRAIIANKLYKIISSENDSFDCSKLNIDTENKKISYDGTVFDVVSSYADLGTKSCNKNDGVINITVPISVEQQSDKDFNVYFKYKLGSTDNSASGKCYVCDSNNPLVLHDIGSYVDCPSGSAHDGTTLSCYGGGSGDYEYSYQELAWYKCTGSSIEIETIHEECGLICKSGSAPVTYTPHPNCGNVGGNWLKYCYCGPKTLP